MNLIDITQKDHSVLRNQALQVSFPLSQEVTNFIEEFKGFIATLKSPHGSPAGLAAPQVGIPWQIILIQIPEQAKLLRNNVYDILPLTVLINPSFEPIKEEGSYKDWEGCYSVENKMGEVYRYHVIKYQAYNQQGAIVKGVARGFLARLLQHEIDHLQGHLYIDRVSNDCRFGDLETMWSLRKAELEGNSN
jgi:peptide deformylase